MTREALMRNIERVDKYSLRINGQLVRGDLAHQSRLEAMSDEQFAAFCKIMGVEDDPARED